ncbi:MAG TPA: hypothetical protein PKJ42_09020 [Candidatus Goldiibacteriota bacterium]|nr:hypothetical protein [Candidatus Goldiibacteriota bacterium]
MLDIKLIRENPDAVKASLAKKGVKPESIDEVLAVDLKRRDIIGTVESLKAENNKKNPEIAKLKKEGKDASALLAEMKAASEKVKSLDADLAKLDEELNIKLLYIPICRMNQCLQALTPKQTSKHLNGAQKKVFLLSLRPTGK